MDASDKFKEVGFLLAENGFVAVLEEMTLRSPDRSSRGVPWLPPVWIMCAAAL
ncbi:MAG: hypothetical protein A4E65_03172 [Syntrophorhabdus sp. PtaU1.Bin153]|nr:MAG: hypothetical protein A4E65_03172 [Syntrophorhabdus sp. PtaU1.Bin153]